MAGSQNMLVYSSVISMTLFLLAPPPAAAHFILLKKLFKGLLGEGDSGYSYSFQGQNYNRPYSYPPPYYGGGGGGGGGYYAGGAGYAQQLPPAPPVGGGYGGYGGAGPAYQHGPAIIGGPTSVSYGSGGSSSSNKNSHHHSSTTFHHEESHSSSSDSHNEGGHHHHHHVSGGIPPPIIPPPVPIGGGVPPYAGGGTPVYGVGNPAGGFGYPGRSGDDSSVEASPYDSIDLRSNNLKASASSSAGSSAYDTDAEIIGSNKNIGSSLIGTDYSVPSVIEPIVDSRASARVVEALPDQPLSSLNLDKVSSEQVTRGGKSYVRFPPFD